MTNPAQTPPSELALQRILESGPNGSEIVQLLIEEHGLHYRIIDGKLCYYAEGTEKWLKQFITVNEKMLLVKNHVRKLAQVNDPVLIVGPTGTGKELLARALHGDRKGQFLGINCAGLPDTLIESELFGHVQGSFTGAFKTKDGIMTEAQDGTLLLDEIGDFPLSVQGKLLRAIQEQRIRKLGSNKEEMINCRIVCATYKPLTELVSKDLFRVDLYARISTFELDTIGLSERTEDIQPIIESLDGGKELMAKMESVGCGTLDVSLNVRSLQKAVRRYQVLGTI